MKLSTPKLIGIVLTGAFIALFLGAAHVYQTIHATILPTEPVYYTVKAGSSFSAVANDLQEKRIIPSAMAFRILAKWQGGTSVQAANYQFQPGISLLELYRDLVEGKSVSDERQITLIEGWSMAQMGDALAQAGIIGTSDDYIKAASQQTERFNDDYPLLLARPAGATLEGYLFPDTYRFFPNSEPDVVIRRQLDAFSKQFDDALRKDIAMSGRNLHDLVILASIVEKEVRSPAEMKTVAGIFANRLEVGMALQADSTVNYITSSGRDRSTYEDITIDSPYNTYKYPGLPKGPISNPGLNAIRAAAAPEQTPYFYFLTDSTGHVYYGKTLEEHNRNRAKYL